MLPWIALALVAIVVAVIAWLAFHRPDPRHAFMFNLANALASSADQEREHTPQQEAKQRVAG